MTSTSRSSMTDEQRAGMAKKLRRRAAYQKSLPEGQREEARRLARGLELINLHRKSKTSET
jgi:hypothetical protein